MQTQHSLNRLSNFYNVIAHTKKIKKPTDLYKFDWDKIREENILDKTKLLDLKDSFNLKNSKTSIMY